MHFVSPHGYAIIIYRSNQKAVYLRRDRCRHHDDRSARKADRDTTSQRIECPFAAIFRPSEHSVRLGGY
jgi:nitrite reductase/ring-hydroxylating ferredoxin subunit